MHLAPTALRVLVGGLFVGHGSQKLFGWFGGGGPDGTGRFFESIGLRPGRRHALLAGATETGGGALLAAGLFTPLAGTLLTSVMYQAARSTRIGNGPFIQQNGWEVEALFAATALSFVETGPGPASLDRLLGTEHSGTRWALLALALGIAGPTLVVRAAAPAEATP